MDYPALVREIGERTDKEKILCFLNGMTTIMHDSNAKIVSESCMNCLDLTCLDPASTEDEFRVFAEKAASQKRHYPGTPNVATLCVPPSFVDVVGLALGDSEIGITSVGGNFPSSSTFLEVKMLECAMAEESGADEIDIVLNLHLFHAGRYEEAAQEIQMIRNELSDDTRLKVILETGLLTDAGKIRRATLTAIAGGADMVKTATGKNGPGATPEAVAVICQTLLDYFQKTGTQIGIKISGGVKTVEDASAYYHIVKHFLGERWLVPALFRIGASGLANDLLSSILGTFVRYY